VIRTSSYMPCGPVGIRSMARAGSSAMRWGWAIVKGTLLKCNETLPMKKRLLVNFVIVSCTGQVAKMHDQSAEPGAVSKHHVEQVGYALGNVHAREYRRHLTECLLPRRQDQVAVHECGRESCGGIAGLYGLLLDEENVP
jgi:hypothetical protein